MRFRAVVGAITVAMLIGCACGVIAARLTSLDPFQLTAHQLDVIRTMAGVLGGIGAILTTINMVFSILAKRWAKRAYENTSTEDWQHGDLVRTPMSEGVRHARIAAEATRQEISDLAGWVKGKGTHREPTRDVPTLYQSGFPDE